MIITIALSPTLLSSFPCSSIILIAIHINTGYGAMKDHLFPRTCILWHKVNLVALFMSAQKLEQQLLLDTHKDVCKNSTLNSTFLYKGCYD